MFEYAGISEDRWFDLINIERYDVILGSPLFYQHACMVGLNPSL
jgi:hypothetical protein